MSDHDVTQPPESDEPDRTPKTTAPERPDARDRTKVGTDEWVAQVEERRERHEGLSGRLRFAWERLSPAGRLVLFAVPAACFPFLVNDPSLFRYGIFTLIYALLALGLNIVVGFAGLLDLGYVAFFGFGAYGYGILASNHSGRHWQAELAIPIVVVATALLGLILGLPSRRLLGDYLAIVTLFFGQAFVVFVNNANSITFPHWGRVDVTGGANGLDQIDPLNFFGFKITTTTGFFYVTLISFVALLTMLHLVNESRTGRALRALREDPLAAEALSIPVNRLKILAFALGAAAAGYTGSIYGAIQTGAFPGDFDVALLITIYAVLLLGGAGSLAGIVFGAIVVNVIPELLRDPGQSRWVLYFGIAAGILVGLRPWRWVAIVLGGLVAFGLAVHTIADAVWPRLTAGHVEGGGFLADAVNNWVLVPSHGQKAGNFAFVLLIVAILALGQLRGWMRKAALIPVLYLAAFAWENRLIQEAEGATRLILLGALLVVLMNARPQGLLGTARVEIV